MELLEGAFDSQLNVDESEDDDAQEETTQDDTNTDTEQQDSTPNTQSSAVTRWLEQCQQAELTELHIQDELCSENTGEVSETRTAGSVEEGKAVREKVTGADTAADTGADTGAAGGSSGDNNSEAEDELPELTGNRDLRPFRDDPEHINANVARNIERGRNPGSICSSATSVAPEVIRQRVKRQFKSQEKIQQSRRIRKHGEAAVQTRKRRDNEYDVKTSLDAGWY